MKFFTVEEKDNVAIITFSRPPVNAYSDESYEEMDQVFRSLNSRNICAAIYRADGKWFSPGNDVKDANEAPTWETQEKSAGLIVKVLNAIYDSKVPIIALTHGYALGASMIFAGACDFVIAGESTKFGLPEIKSGICMGWTWLEEFTSPQMARYMYYTGNPVSAQDLFHLGHILKIVPDDKLLDEAMAIAKEIKNRAPSAIRLGRMAMNHNNHKGVTDNLKIDLLCNEVFFKDHFDERVEALHSFLEKREPRFYTE